MGGGNLYLSINGGAEQSFAQAPLFSSSAPLRAGSFEGTADFFLGSMALVEVYNQALGQGQVTEIYGAGLASQPWERSPEIKDLYALAIPMNTGIASGRELEDYSGNENDATPQNAPTLTGAPLEFSQDSNKFNTFAFDGTDDRIIVTETATLRPSAEISLSLWIDPASTTTFDGVFARWENAGSRSWAIFIDPANVHFRISNDGTNPAGAIQNAHPVSGKFTHVCCTYDGANMKMYYDGVEVATTPLAVSINTNVGSDIFISDFENLNAYYTGDIAMPMIFNRGLTVDEVGDLYNRNLPKFYDKIPTSITTDCILALELSGNDDTANDLSGYGHNGSKEGGVGATGTEINFDDTGVKTSVGSHTNTTVMYDMAFDPTSGTLYGVSSEVGTATWWSINTSTGLATSLGTDGGVFCPLAGLVFDSTGQAYNAQGMSCSGGLYDSINKANGAHTNITTLTAAATPGAALVRRSNNNAFYANGTNISPSPLATGALGGAVALAGAISLRTMTEAAGTVYGVRIDGSGGSSTLVSVDPLTGANSAIGANQTLYGIAVNV
jgi:hypothetical protein